MENNQNIVASEHAEKDTVFSPEQDLQIVMQGGLPVSVIVPMAEFDRMTLTIALAEELLEGKELFLEDGTKVTFKQMADQRVAADRAEYEAELAAMFDEEDCDDHDACEDEN